MSKLTQHQNKTIEEYWSEINDYRKKLQFREWELLENKSNDENIGGGKSNIISDPTANKATILANDTRYQHLKNIVTTLERVYEQLDDDQKVIVQMRYWDDENCYEWAHIADKLYMSVQRVLRKRNNLLDKTAEALGWL